MKKFLRQRANLSSASTMETRDHSKNGASPKNRMSRGNIIIYILMGILLSSCGTTLMEVQVDHGYNIEKYPDDAVTLIEVGGRAIANVKENAGGMNLSNVGWRIGGGIRYSGSDTIQPSPVFLTLGEWGWDFIRRSRFTPYFSVGFGYMYYEKSRFLIKPNLGVRYFFAPKTGIYANVSSLNLTAVTVSLGLSFQIQSK